MQLTRTRTDSVNIEVSIRPRVDEDGSRDGTLAVYVGDWPWNGPLASAQSAIDSYDRTQRELRERFQSYVGPRPFDTYSIAIAQALAGQTPHHPGTEAMSNGRIA